MRPQLQSMCHYIAFHYVKIRHVRKNMHPLRWGEGLQLENIQTIHYDAEVYHKNSSLEKTRKNKMHKK